MPINPFLLIVLIVIIIVTVLLIFMTHVILPKKRLTTVFNQLNVLLEPKSFKYNLKASIKEAYDFKLTIDDKEYVVKIITVSPNNNIVITNKTTWIETPKTGSLNIKNRLSQVEDFINYKVDTNGEDVKKIIIVYPEVKQILKYKNENEMIFVKNNTNVYGANIIFYSELNEFIDTLK